jgi:hypothetical protein
VIIPVITGTNRTVMKVLKEKFGSHTRKMFSRFTTKVGCTWNITHKKESTAV